MNTDDSADHSALLADMKTEQLIALRVALDARLEEARENLKAQVVALDGTCSFHNGATTKKKGRPSKSKNDAD